MKNAGIIIIGNEILSGRTMDKNSNFICKNCTEMGLQVNKVIIIPDNKRKIIKIVKEFSKEYDHVFVTGGIGPTHDDITAEAVATAFKRKLQLNLKAKKLLISYYNKSNIELNDLDLLTLEFFPKVLGNIKPTSPANFSIDFKKSRFSFFITNVIVSPFS